MEIVTKATNAGFVALSIGAAILSGFMMITFLSLWISFGNVYKNVHRRSKVRVHVNSNQDISLLDLQDPYNIFKGASFGSDSGLSKADANGLFYISLPANSRYDFKKSVSIQASIEEGFVVPKTINSTSLTLAPYMVVLVSTDYVLQPISDPYDMYVTITWEQPASS